MLDVQSFWSELIPFWWGTRAFRRFILICLLVLPNVGSATTVVALRSDRRIIVAADSMMGVMKNGSVVSRSLVCKARRVDDIVFANAGLEFVGTISFSAIATRNLSGPGSFSVRLKAYYAETDAALGTALRALKDGMPMFFKDQVGKTVFSTLVATVQQGVPILVGREYKLSLNADGSVKITSSETRCPGDCPAVNGILVLAGGEHGAIDGYLGVASFGKIPPASWPDRMAQMVQMEIDALPDKVGPPISVIVLDSTGIHWHNGESGVCNANLK